MKDNNSTLLSLAMASPTAGPPQIIAATAPGILFRSKTLAIILVVAIDISVVVDAPFQRTVFPQAWYTKLI